MLLSMCCFLSRRRHTICALVTGVHTFDLPIYRDLLIVGYWTDWDYLNQVLGSVLDQVHPSKVIVVDPVDSASFQSKAPDLYALSDAVQNGLLHVRASGADFLGALRKSFSNTFFRRLVTCGAEEFQNRTGNPPPQAITEPPNLDTEALCRMRRDLEGCAPNQQNGRAHV